MENRDSLIPTHYGERELRIASLKVDSLRAQEAIRSTINNIIKNKIDVACVQETHNERIDSINVINYAIIFGGCSANNENDLKSETGGIAFVANNLLVSNIIHINRIDGRIMKIQFKTGPNIPNLSILNPYDPHAGRRN